MWFGLNGPKFSFCQVSCTASYLTVFLEPPFPVKDIALQLNSVQVPTRKAEIPLSYAFQICETVRNASNTRTLFSEQTEYDVSKRQRTEHGVAEAPSPSASRSSFLAALLGPSVTAPIKHKPASDGATGQGNFSAPPTSSRTHWPPSRPTGFRHVSPALESPPSALQWPLGQTPQLPPWMHSAHSHPAQQQASSAASAPGRPWAPPPRLGTRVPGARFLPALVT